MHAAHGYQDAGPQPIRTTLLSLVRTLTEQGLEPDEIVRSVRELLESGQVVLTGNFRDGLFGPGNCELHEPAAADPETRKRR